MEQVHSHFTISPTSTKLAWMMHLRMLTAMHGTVDASDLHFMLECADKEDDVPSTPPKKRQRDTSPDSDVTVTKKKNKTLDDFFGKKKKDKDEDEDDLKKDASPVKDEDKEEEEEDIAGSDCEVDNSEGEEEEDIDAPPSPTDVKDNIKQKYGMEMPADFYDFWDFCSKENSKRPREALREALGLTLVGPYDILAGRHKGVTTNKRGKRPNFKLHYRFYYDPPEFTTILIGDKSKQFHFGYFRDDPSELPVFVATNSAADSGTISPKGDNVFAAVKLYIDDQLKAKGIDADRKKKLVKVQEKITNAGKKYCLDAKSKSMKERDKKVVCKTFHGAGIVVPVDENEVGYREVPETPADLKRMFKKVVESKSKEERDKNMDPIQELITLVQFANDECDYGEGLELGLDLFTYGGDALHSMIQHLLPLAYQLLHRNLYADIVKAHLKHRERGINDELQV
ncbi:hypothetical protein FSP39_018155 [Pinctada imbricata]|uniref:Histone PARylation factor 1 n=1 Tax=Pinctada imbricata TaxID=66713 RepID=A0AA89C925_PINIB|nr:hypothetical protein FSP39_018155 [Pinctada imbricata]